MENDDLLDDAKILQDQLVLDMIQWWEKRRLLYNVIVGLTGIASILAALKQNIHIDFSEILLWLIVPFGIIANIAYLAGWVFDLLLRYYFKINLSISVRQGLFWVGTGISIAPLLLAMILVLTS